MKDIIRDSTVGQLINRLSSGRYLPYADQRSDYSIPARFIPPSSLSRTQTVSTDDKQILSATEETSPATISPRTSASLTRINTLVEGSVHDYEKGEVKKTELVYDPYLVGWNGDDDPENPRYVFLLSLDHFLNLRLEFSNWSFGKRAFTTFSISFLTFSVYIGSAIYTPAIPGLIEAFDISLPKATLGLTLYVLGEYPI